MAGLLGDQQRLAGILAGMTPLMVPPNPMRQSLTKQYPWTAGVDFNLIDSTAKGDPSRKLEFYQQGEKDSPSPHKPTIEVFDKTMGAPDLMGELLSHHLPKIDPNVAQYRAQILQSMTPEQRASIQGDYANEYKSGLVDKGDNFSGWLNKQGGDSFFRGYPTGQWPASTYTPQQIQIYQQLQNYLSTKFRK